VTLGAQPFLELPAVAGVVALLTGGVWLSVDELARLAELGAWVSLVAGAYVLMTAGAWVLPAAGAWMALTGRAVVSLLPAATRFDWVRWLCRSRAGVVLLVGTVWTTVVVCGTV
jgi:hypothetical protein